MKREEVYKLIDGEREYQDKRWDPQEHGNHTPEEWVLYMEDYLLEAKHLLSRDDLFICRPKAMEIIRKVTAMGVCAMEQNVTKPRNSGTLS